MENKIIKLEIAWLKKRIAEFPEINKGTYHKQLEKLTRLLKITTR